MQSEGECWYFIPNLHTLNTRPKPEELVQNTVSTVAWLLALGVDPKKSVIFAQSQVPAHSELFNILNNFVTMGELSRMTQFKDKSLKSGREGALAAVFEYPVLMAADIILYDADFVPVGEDQKQHVELTRDIVKRFNNIYGPTFNVPEPILPKVGARIMNLQDPDKKMSKSDSDQKGVIQLTDSPDEITGKIKKAATDSGSDIKAAKDKPAITNLLHIYSVFSERSIEELEKEYEGKNYGEFKASLADTIITTLRPLQERYAQIVSDNDAIYSVLEEGAEKANKTAGAKLAHVKTKLGLI